MLLSHRKCFFFRVYEASDCLIDTRLCFDFSLCFFSYFFCIFLIFFFLLCVKVIFVAHSKTILSFQFFFFLSSPHLWHSFGFTSFSLTPVEFKKKKKLASKKDFILIVQKSLFLFSSFQIFHCWWNMINSHFFSLPHPLLLHHHIEMVVCSSLSFQLREQQIFEWQEIKNTSSKEKKYFKKKFRMKKKKKLITKIHLHLTHSLSFPPYRARSKRCAFVYFSFCYAGILFFFSSYFFFCKWQFECWNFI